MSWDGEEYQRRFDDLAARGVDVHGEADFVGRYEPRTVLDAGCGSGRVAIELARRGMTVTGVDADASMIAAARARAPEIDWHHADLTDFDLDARFDVVVMAGNVPLFTPPGTRSALVAGCARHVGSGGRLIAGFQLDRGYDLAAYDADTAVAGLALAERFATWDAEPFDDGRGDYAVSVHMRAR